MENNILVQRKDPWLAVSLSWLLPCVGQIYARRIWWGITVFLLYLLILATTIFMVIEFPIFQIGYTFYLVVGTIFYVLSAFDAYRLVNRDNAKLTVLASEIKTSKNSWLAAFLSLLFPGLGQLYCKRWVKGIFIIIGIIGLWVISIFMKNMYPIRLIYCGVVIYDAWASARGELKPSKKPIIIFVIAVILYALLFNAVQVSLLPGYNVPTGSMKPTIMPGDKLFTERITYKFANPKRDEIITFIDPRDPKRILVSRIVGIGGDTVEVKDYSVYVNGEIFREYQQPEKYLFSSEIPGNNHLFDVPESRYFVIGDNIDSCIDSRIYGPIPKANVIGRVIGNVVNPFAAKSW